MKRNLWRLRDTGFLARCAENNHDVLVTFNNSNDSILKIPPKAHFIWLGSKEMPSYAHMCINSFIRLHPAWAVKVWKDCDIESLGDFKNKSALLSCTNMGMYVFTYLALFHVYIS
ncbi:hypothetical protein EON65_21195 [archaeon]|nr:MAG: hypothetical protein EON65_21195 [archaeon]